MKIFLHLLLTVVCFIITILFLQVSADAATITVAAGGDLQLAINLAQPGDEIVLEAGASFVGAFYLPNKGDMRGQYITIQSSRAAELADGERVSPDDTSKMAKLMTAGLAEPVITTEAGASYYRFVGIELTRTSPDAFLYDLIQLGDGSSEQNTIEKTPHHLIIDRCYIHGDSGELKRGIALNSSYTDILNSYISEFHIAGQDSSAIGGWNGGGNYRLINNFIQAAGINLLLGGAWNARGIAIENVEVRRNYFHKPAEWAGVWTVKNLFELKNCRNAVIDGNVFEGSWGDAQVGFAVLFTPRTSDSGDGAVVENIDFINNIVYRSPSGINILGIDDTAYDNVVRGRNIRVYNNLFQLDSSLPGVQVFAQIIHGATNVTIDHNTIIHDGHIALMDGEQMPGFVFTNNIARHNEYGIFGSNAGVGTAALNAYAPGAVMTHNLIIGAPQMASAYPNGNFFPEGFVGFSGDEFTLPPNSPYKNAGTDGKDIGVDIEAMRAAMGNQGTPQQPVPSPIPLPLPTPAPTPIESGIYTIVVKSSAKVLDISGGSLGNGANLIQYTNKGSNNQQFIVEPVANGYYKIIARHSGKALEIYGFSQDNGASANQWEFHGGDNQLWRIEEVEAGYYKIVAKYSNKALDIYGSSQNNKTKAVQWDYHGGDNQKWKFERVQL